MYKLSEARKAKKLEIAREVKKLYEVGLTQQEISKKVGMSQSWVSLIINNKFNFQKSDDTIQK